MCGLFGFWLKRPLKENEIFDAKEQLNNLFHRGPNNQNSWYDKNNGIFLGHTRLSIIGLDKKNNQPMHDSSSVIIFNGELYNYKNIKNSLVEKGYKFKSDSDTEVIQHAWNLWGEKCLDFFDGMFAFAIYDYKNLYLVNDFFGEKPLYYINLNEGLYFASEAKILVDFLKIKFSLNSQEELFFLSLGYLPTTSTGFKNLNYLEPASIINYNPNKEIQFKKYWSLKTINDKERKKQIEKKDIKIFRNHIIESLESRLNADVNIGIFLSSGIDSTLVAALTKKELNQNLQSFTVSFPTGVDESHHAKKIANYLEIDHKTISDNSKPNNLVDSIFDIYGTLNDNLTAISIRQISKAAKKHITVALGGIGGDELFYGYNKYSFVYDNEWMYKMNISIFSNIINFLSGLNFSNKIQNFNHYINCNEDQRFLALKDLQTKKLFSQLKIKIPKLGLINENKNLIQKIRDFDINNTLPNSYLPSIDRGSMKESVEVRTPYLNRKLFEYANLFDPKAFMINEKKYVQKNILKEYLPDEYISLDKKGFVMPIRSFLDNANLNYKFLPSYLSKLSNIVSKNKKTKNFEKIVFRMMLLNNFYSKYAK